MEGLDEMKDAESIGGRFVMKEYISDEAKKLLDSVEAERKAKKRRPRRLKNKTFR